jgi:predicted phosphodiesterase
MSRVLVIKDIHEPFCLDGYLEHCKKQYKDFKCDNVVFIGDIINITIKKVRKILKKHE